MRRQQVISGFAYLGYARSIIWNLKLHALRTDYLAPVGRVNRTQCINRIAIAIEGSLAASIEGVIRCRLKQWWLQF